MTHHSIEATTQAVKCLHGFVPKRQLEAIGNLCRGEEGQFFRAKLIELAKTVADMPATYEQDGLGDDAVAHLHYFGPSCDFWITEKDCEPEQNQAFGLADMGNQELGYISLMEITDSPQMEIDLHFSPTSLRVIREQL